MDREKPPEKHFLSPSPVAQDVSMTDSDTKISETEPPLGLSSVARRVIERRPRDRPKDAFIESQTYVSGHIDGSSRTSPQNSFPSMSTKMMVELSRLDEYTPFSKTVERLFYDTWVDQTKNPQVDGIILFDIKTFSPLPDGQIPHNIKSASRDTELLSLLSNFPLRFYGARRACYIGDPGYPLDLCDNVDCAICPVFQSQCTARKAGISFELGPGIPASPNSSQADAFATNHHIHSYQHAVVLCACPNIAQSDTQATHPDDPPPYTANDSPPHIATASPGTVVVPIGLIMYTRTGWHPS
ncbi:hypothetical protein N7457_002201 [Penicillium paradoxum]|uniref:uncharacterized protein n=1 Tax=Penicillium paradoxum TaxID=176176 RepID=UPI0025465AC1|nr:uncharacterized protein N7457_002201 [Penicillium paradoxum]KAJ5787211.1 hypothetical protein N7457_002201 [Penicillium paradoxum]